MTPTPIVKFPILDENSVEFRNLSKPVWNSIKYLKTKYNNQASDLFSFYSKYNQVLVPDSDAYTKFESFISLLAEDVNKRAYFGKLKYTEKDGLTEELNDIQKRIDDQTLENSSSVSSYVRINRNIEGYAYNKFINHSEKIKLNNTIVASLINKEFKLVDRSTLSQGFIEAFSLLNLISEEQLPSELEFYSHPDYSNAVVVLNNLDHIEVYIENKETEVLKSLVITNSIISTIFGDDELKCDFDKVYGVLSSCLKNLAFGLSFISVVDVSKQQLNEDIEKLLTKTNTTASEISVDLSKERVVIKSTSLLGLSLISIYFHHLNQIKLVNNIIKGSSLNELSLEDLKQKSQNNDLVERIHKVYKENFPQYKELIISDSNNINTIVETIASTYEVSSLVNLKYFFAFFKAYFSSFLEKPEKIESPYYYFYSKESFSVLKNSNYKLEDIKKYVSAFTLDIQRLVKVSISENYVNSIMSSAEFKKPLVDTKISAIESLSVSGKLNKISMKISDIEFFTIAKEILTVLYEKSKVVFKTLENHFISDTNLGLLTDDIRTIGSGFMISFEIKLFDTAFLSNYKEKFNFSFYQINKDSESELKTFLIEVNTFGKFICKTTQDAINLIDSAIACNEEFLKNKPKEEEIEINNA